MPAPRTIEYPWMSVATWNDMQRAEAAVAARGGVDLLFLGDSLTEGWGGPGAEAWRQHFAPLRAAAFGIGGDATQNVLWRLAHGAVGALRPTLVVLLIGVNNLGNLQQSPPDVARGIAAVVAQLRTSFPAARLLVLGIFPHQPALDAPERAKIAAVNATLPALADDVMIFHQDISHVFLEPDGTITTDVMPDYLHLSPEGYRRWAEAIHPTVRRLLKR